MISRLYIFLVAFVVVIIDQISKNLVSSELMVGERVILIKNIISMTKAYNTGAAFSILQDKTPILVFFSLLVTLIISLYFIKKAVMMNYFTVIGWGLILGGTVGNLIDRAIFGYVIDFVRLDFINFPIFNIADMSINIGALLVIIHNFSHPAKSGKNES